MFIKCHLLYLSNGFFFVQGIFKENNFDFFTIYFMGNTVPQSSKKVVEKSNKIVKTV